MQNKTTKPWQWLTPLLVATITMMSVQSAEAKRKRPRATTTTTTTSTTSTTLPPSTTSTTLPANVPISVTRVGGSVSMSSVSHGQVNSLKASLLSATNLSGLIIDLRVTDSANQMVLRKAFDNSSLSAGVPTEFQFDYLIPATLAAGTYRVHVGVWTATWATLLYDTFGSFSVVSGSSSPTTTTTTSSTTTTTLVQLPPTSPTEPISYQAPVSFTSGNFTLRSAIALPSMMAGQVQHAKLLITSSTATGDVIVSLRYLDPAGNQMIDRSVTMSFYAGETKEMKLDYAIRLDASGGTYSVGVGIWSGDWSHLYLYQRNLPAFTVQASGYVRPPLFTSVPDTNFNMTSGLDAFVYNGAYFVQNNMWGVGGYPAGTYYTASAGVGPLTSTGGVQARWKWDYPNMDVEQEVKGYPAVGIGQKPGQRSTPGSNLPKHIGAINSVMTSWDVQAVYTGRGHLAFDLWLTRDPNLYSCFPCTPITHEIMVAVDDFNNNYAMGNPAWYFSSAVINGVTYRIWKADNFGSGWRFIVLQMMNPIHVTKGSLDFKPIFDYLKSVGLISGQEYLSSIEFGHEMVYGTGDVFVRDFKAEVK